MSDSQIFGALLVIGAGYVVLTMLTVSLAGWLAWQGHYLWAILPGVPGASLVWYAVRAWRGR